MFHDIQNTGLPFPLLRNIYRWGFKIFKTQHLSKILKISHLGKKSFFSYFENGASP